MTVTVRIEEQLSRVIVTVPPNTRWAAFQREVIGAIEDAPHITDWNWIIDEERQQMDDVDVDGMMRIGRTFRRHTRTPERAVTIVVTNDRFYALWARVMNYNFWGRQHQGAKTLREAEAMLDRIDTFQV